MLFETAFSKDFEYYERVFDGEKSIKRKITVPFEWYEPQSNGIYSYILDENVKLDKKQGTNPKFGRDKYGFLDPIYRNIRDNYWNKEGYNKNPRIWYLDIETRVNTCSDGFPEPFDALEPICLVQVFDNKLNKMFVLGVREWKHQQNYSFDYEVIYIKCKDELELLENFIKLFKKLDPLIIYAWNGLGFDFPYIYNRLKKFGLENDLSNYGDVSCTHYEFQGKIEYKFYSHGHYFMDLMEIYKKFTFHPMPSYSLDTVSEYELGERKVQHTEYASFDDFYTGKYIIPQNPTEEQKNSRIYQEAIKGNWEEVKELSHSEFVYYGIKDTYLIKKIDDALNFTMLMLMIAEKMGVKLDDTLGTVKPWAQFIANVSYLENKIMPPKREFEHPDVVGGYVKEPVKGKHKWVISFDVNSMYPLLGMVGFNMSPETFVPKANLSPDLRDIILSYFNDQNEDKLFEIDEKVWKKIQLLLKRDNLALGINGALFRRDKIGMIPRMVQEIYNSRKKAKNTMNKYKQKAVEIKEILKQRGVLE